ncbi:MAG: hypothetical protein ABIG92_06410 [Candidatus Omnitrophota bacterium]
MIKQYIISFLVAFVLSIILTPLIKKMALAKGFVAKPREDRWHKKEVALFGGVAIFISFIIPYVFLVHITVEGVGIIVCGAIMFLFGLFDDIRHIKPYTKLIGQIIVASLLVVFGVRINIIPYDIVSVPLTVLWMLIIVNAINLLDNMDGLAAGVAAIISAILFLFTFLNGNFTVSLPALILAGSLFGFLRYNFSPAKIFMGDCGSMFIGFMLATITLQGSWKESTHLLMVLAIPVLVLAVPIFDTAFVALMRGLSSRNVFQGGKDHISHRMVVLGLSDKKAVMVLYIICIVFGAISVLSMFVHPLVTTILVLLVSIFFIYFTAFLGKVKVYSDADIIKVRKKENNVVLNSILLHKRRILEVFVDFILICVAYISSYLLRYEGILLPQNQVLITRSLPIILIIKYIVFVRFGLYRGFWRYIGIPDMIDIFKAITVSSVISTVILLFIWRFQDFSRAVFIIDWLLLFVLISGVRILERIYKEIFDQVGLKGKRALIYGAGDAGEFIIREIKNNKLLNYKPIIFLDDDEEKIGKRIHGITVFGPRGELPRLVKHNDIDEVIIAIPNIPKHIFDEIVGFCHSLDVPYKRMHDILPG